VDTHGGQQADELGLEFVGQRGRARKLARLGVAALATDPGAQRGATAPRSARCDVPCVAGRAASHLLCEGEVAVGEARLQRRIRRAALAKDESLVL